MLRVQSSRNNKQRHPLGRSKSASSIARNHIYDLHSNPIIAERDAHIAARLSYQRDKGRNGEGMAAVPHDAAGALRDTPEGGLCRHALPHGDSTRSHQELAGNVIELKRQQSIRFAGPNAMPRRALGSRASDNQLADTSSHNGPGSFGHAGWGCGRSGLSDGADASFSSTTNPLRDLRVLEQSHPPEDVISPKMPHCRQIRKSRSMFTASDRSGTGYYFTNDSPRHTEPTRPSRYAGLNKENMPMYESEARSLRAPKSMSFLRGRQEQTTPQASSRATNDLAVRLAREQFQGQVKTQSKLKSHPSTFFRSKVRRRDSSMGLRKSLRNRSHNDTALSSAFSGDTVSIPKQGSLRNKARKASRTLRKRLRGIFGRHATSDDPGEHTEQHPSNHDSDDNNCLRLDAPTQPEEASISRGPSLIASIHAVPSSQKLRSRRGSLESCGGGDGRASEDKSRVTSWTDSVSNAAASQYGVGDWARQSLSVIRENGMNMPLQSNRPVTRPEATSDQVIKVDSQRVYSALMKRASESRQREEELREQSIGEIGNHGRAPPRTSSVNQLDSHEWSPPTIRHQPSDDDVFQDKNSDTHKERIEPLDLIKTKCSSITDITSRNDSPNPWVTRDVGRVPSPGQAGVHCRMDSDCDKAHMHRSSALSASPSCHLFRTTSPFRRTLQENMKAAEEKGEAANGSGHSYLDSLSAVSLPTRCPSTTGSEKDATEICAESVYSDAMDEAKIEEPLPDRCTEPPPAQASGRLVDPSYPYGNCPAAREVSVASSTGWKMGLSAEGTKLEETVINPMPEFGSSRCPSRFEHVRHVQGKAEIESPTEVVRPSPRSVAALTETTALKPLGIHSRCNSPQKPVSRSSIVTTGKENISPTRIRCSPSPKTNSVPSKHSFRTVASLPTLVTGQSGPSPKREERIVAEPARSGAVPRSRSSRDEVLLERRTRVRLAGKVNSSVNSSPGLTLAVERQFGTTFTGSPWKKPSKRPSKCNQEEASFATSKSSPVVGQNGSTRPSQGGLNVGAQAVGSKKMVQTFLNSRRRTVDGTTTNSENDSSPAVIVQTAT